MEKVKILSLHGFLGLPSDWDLIQSYFMASPMIFPMARQFEWWSVDYMNSPELGPECDLDTWAKTFNAKVLQRFPQGPRVLVGYSLGGRLALHAMARDPALYDKAILVSTNPGLQRDKDKEVRAKSDLRWSQEFLNTSWMDLMKAWNAQPVFKDSQHEPQRSEASYDRHKLAQALRTWSLAQQQDFRDFIVQMGSQILWVSGEKDIQFASQTMELRKRSLEIQTEIFPKASHRVLFDQPSELAQKMISFILDSRG